MLPNSCSHTSLHGRWARVRFLVCVRQNKLAIAELLENKSKLIETTKQTYLPISKRNYRVTERMGHERADWGRRFTLLTAYYIFLALIL